MQPVYEDLAFCIFSGLVMMIVAVVVKIVLCCVDDDDVDHDDTGNVCFIYDVHSSSQWEVVQSVYEDLAYSIMVIMMNMIVGPIKVRCSLHAIQIKNVRRSMGEFVISWVLNKILLLK